MIVKGNKQARGKETREKSKPPKQFCESELLETLLALIRDESFRQVVAQLDGYDPSPMGQIAAEV